jgi:hypothetical protein
MAGYRDRDAPNKRPGRATRIATTSIIDQHRPVASGFVVKAQHTARSNGGEDRLDESRVVMVQR